MTEAEKRIKEAGRSWEYFERNYCWKWNIVDGKRIPSGFLITVDEFLNTEKVNKKRKQITFRFAKESTYDWVQEQKATNNKVINQVLEEYPRLKSLSNDYDKRMEQHRLEIETLEKKVQKMRNVYAQMQEIATEGNLFKA